MTCTACGDGPKKENGFFPKAVVEINNPETLVLFRKVVIPISLGDEETIPPAIGKYRNVLLVYEANNNAYLYSSDGIPTKLTSDVAQELEDRINEVANDLASETAARQLADETLDNTISGVRYDLTNETTNRQNADLVLQGNIDAEVTARENADTGLNNRLTAVEGIAATALQPNDIDTNVMTNLANAATSVSTVQLTSTKQNLKTGVTGTENVSLPVASSLQAGVMNVATYEAVTSNTSNINALLNGAVAITGISATPSQADLTTAWQNETGLTVLINRASIYDVTNQKVWTYYTNDTTWHEASNTAQVTVNQATNSSLGTVMGSTSTGQAFVENDGTLSINGWDTLSNDVNNATTKLATIATGAEVNVQANWNEADSNSDAYIQNKPTIPTVNNATLTIQKNGTTVQTFTANASSNKTANIAVPTKVSELTNDSGYTTNTGTITAVQANGTSVATSGTANIPSATTSRYGVTQLSTSTSSTSTALAATPSAVKAAYDLANGKATITMQTTDPGAGSTLAANNFIAVYTA